MFQEQLVTRRVNYCKWFLDVLSWDAALPIFVLLLPYSMSRAFPQLDELPLALAVFLPIFAFILRCGMGLDQIRHNACCGITRGLQVLFFGVGAIMLMGLESITILTQNIPQCRLSPAEWKPLGVVAMLYLGCMTFAWYPGRTETEINTWQ